MDIAKAVDFLDLLKGFLDIPKNYGFFCLYGQKLFQIVALGSHEDFLLTILDQKRQQVCGNGAILNLFDDFKFDHKRFSF